MTGGIVGGGSLSDLGGVPGKTGLSMFGSGATGGVGRVMVSASLLALCSTFRVL
ncbi:Unknown protein sequence [Pseudomonas syringae pv. maculicola]|nr:Unknown protein sequence [Pseudomonas syringae pv. maculicola]